MLTFVTVTTMAHPTARRWCFTLNNYTEDDEQAIGDFCEGPRCTYGVVGRERGAEGTPHLQGFVILANAMRLPFLRNAISPRAHYEIARGTSLQAADYCKKEGDFDEYGEFPSEQGKRSDIERFRIWVESLDVAPSQRAIAQQFPGLFLRYPRLAELGGHLRPFVDISNFNDTFRVWQGELNELLRGEPDDRSVHFYVDTDGGKGKSWFVRNQISKHPEITQFLSVGKRDDLAYAIDETKTVFLFDLPRGSMEHFQYTILEKLKDQLLFSSKYNSRVKVLPKPVHVVVFCNEDPDMTAMTQDRYVMHYI